jgi:NADH-quinone oxidoreductase subunit L
MFLGVGVGAFTAGFFHVFTHAFFKACLFLGAGSVIHAMHARIHDEDRSQDMRNMGGLKRYMPVTFWTFVISTAAIVGFPLTAGFFSKDEILAQALVSNPVGVQMGKVVPWTAPTWVPWVLWIMGTLAATMTAFYMCRAVFLTFYGDFKGWTVGRPSMLAKKEAEAAHDDDDDDHHHEEDLSQPGYPPHESPRAMTIPLIVLAAFAAAAGFLNPAALKLFAHAIPLPVEHWLEPGFAEGARGGKALADAEAHSREIIATIGGLGAFGIGTYAAYWVYVINAGKPAKQLALAWPRLYRWAYNKWFVDEAYDKSVVAGVDALADTASSVDQGLVDFVIARLTSLIVAASGTVLRVVQNGVVHVYAAVMVVGLAVLGWFFITPHADFSVNETPSGDYTLVAAPGPGYAFKWYPDATKEPAQKDFAAQDNIKVHLDAGKSQTVKLEVRNAFGRTDTKEMVLKRPAEDKPPPTAMQMGGM